MNGGALNEAFQWIAIVGVLLLTLAVYRQLGLMVGNPAAFLARSSGPDVGDRVDRWFGSLFPAEVMRPWSLLLFVREDCPACKQLLNQIKRWMRDRALSDSFELAIAVAPDTSNSYVRELKRRFEKAIVTEQKALLTQDDRIDAYPLTLLLDANRVVRLKAVGSNTESLLSVIGGNGHAAGDAALHEEVSA